VFFFDFVNPTPAQKKPRKTSKSSKPELPLYSPSGHYTRNQKVQHPKHGPGVVTLVRIGMIVILFDSKKQDPPQLVLCEIPVKGQRFISARINLAERDKANGGTFAYRRARNIANLGAALRRKRKLDLLAVPRPWLPLVCPDAPKGTQRWQHEHPAFPRHTATIRLHGAA
jgi:hypothetical protein